MTDFSKLYKQHAREIYHFALLLCGNSAEAEDITAETFARALTGKSPIIALTAKGYLLAIARNLYLESLRRKRPYIELQPEIPDLQTPLEKVIIDKSELEALLTYLQTLPEVDRAAVLLVLMASHIRR